MAVEVKVPAMGESVVEATVGRWLKKAGDSIAIGDTLVELETDKVNVEVTAENSGVLAAISHAEGDTVNVGDVLATLSDAASAAPAVTVVETPPAVPSLNGDKASETAEPVETQSVTPLARQLAEEKGINLSQLTGTGPGGKITKDDVTAYTSIPTPVAVTPTPVSTQPTPTVSTPVATVPTATSSANGRPEERQRMSRRRQTIATRLVEAQHNAAMLTTFNEIDMSAVMELRTRRKDSFKERYGVGLGFMSFFTKASIGALKAFPRLNAEIQGTDIVLKQYYDIGVAVSTEEGLVVPVVRDADRLTFAAIEKEIGRLAGRARENTLSLPELQGGTFTITNGGVFGSLMSTPILNAPQVGILGMHTIQQRPVAVNGQVVIKPMMYVALSYDHRIVDGSEAVRFLVKIKELVEDPETLLLEG